MANDVWKLVNELHRRASIYENYVDLPDSEKITVLNDEISRVNSRLSLIEAREKSAVSGHGESQSET